MFSNSSLTATHPFPNTFTRLQSIISISDQDRNLSGQNKNGCIALYETMPCRIPKPPVIERGPFPTNLVKIVIRSKPGIRINTRFSPCCTNSANTGRAALPFKRNIVKENEFDLWRMSACFPGTQV